MLSMSECDSASPFNASVHLPPFVSTTCINWIDHQRHDDAYIHELCLSLAETHVRGVRGEEFDELEVAAGMGYSDFGLINNPRINVVSQVSSCTTGPTSMLSAACWISKLGNAWLRYRQRDRQALTQ